MALQALPMQMDPTGAIAGPQGSSMLPAGLPKGPTVPCYITALTFPAGAFKHIILKASGKEYAYWGCDKTSSNWDTMVSHYLHDHLSLYSLSQVWDELFRSPQISGAMVETSIICCFTSLYNLVPAKM